jgi:hypothetical protein
LEALNTYLHLRTKNEGMKMLAKIAITSRRIIFKCTDDLTEISVKLQLIRKRKAWPTSRNNQPEKPGNLQSCYPGLYRITEKHRDNV